MMASPVDRPDLKESRKRRRVDTTPDASSIQPNQSLDSSYPSVIYTIESQASRSSFYYTGTPTSNNFFNNIGSCCKEELLKSISTPNLVDTSCESGERYGNNFESTSASKPAVAVSSWIAPRARLKSALTLKAIHSDPLHHESQHCDSSFAGQEFKLYHENSGKGNPLERNDELQLSECESVDTETSNVSSSGISYTSTVECNEYVLDYIDYDNNCNEDVTSENDDTSMQISSSVGISYADSCSSYAESEARQENDTCDELRASLFSIEKSFDREDDKENFTDTDTYTAYDDLKKSYLPKNSPEAFSYVYSEQDSPKSEVLDEEEARKLFLDVTKRNANIAEENAALMKQIAEGIYAVHDMNDSKIQGLYEDLTLSDFVEQPPLQYSTQRQDCILFDDIDAQMTGGYPDDELNQEAFEQKQTISSIIEPASQQMRDVIAGLEPMKHFSPVEYDFDCKLERWYAQISPHISGIYYHQPSSGELARSPPTEYIDTSDVRHFVDQIIKSRVATTSPQCRPRNLLHVQVDYNIEPDGDFVKLVTPVSRTEHDCKKKMIYKSILKKSKSPCTLARIMLSFSLILILACAFWVWGSHRPFVEIFGVQTVAYNLMPKMENAVASPSTLHFRSLVSRQCFWSDRYCAHLS